VRLGLGRILAVAAVTSALTLDFHLGDLGAVVFFVRRANLSWPES
jgi:hypothetical protein